MYKKLISLIFISSLLIAEIPYSLDSLLNYQQANKGFHSNNFWEAMRWGRDETSEEFYTDQDVTAAKKNFEYFCDRLDAPSEQIYIPHTVHLIWLGSEMPKKVIACFDSWKRHHPDWKVHIWTDNDIPLFNWSCDHSKCCFEEADTWAEKADILRLEILYQYGGLYSDADVVCLNAFDALTIQPLGFFSCFELNYVSKHYGESFFVGSAVMGSCKESKVLKYCIEHLRAKSDAPDEGIIKRTGPGLISRACQMALRTECEFVLILPCSYLYPLPWKKRETNAHEILDYISPDSLAIHLWDGSWLPLKKKK